MLSDMAMRQTAMQGGGFAADAKSLPIGSGAVQRLRQASATDFEIRQLAEDLAGRLLGNSGVAHAEMRSSGQTPEPNIIPPFVAELHEVAERIEQQQTRALAALRALLDAFG